MISIGTSLKGRPGIDRPIRVLHCPTNVGNNPQCLARMERELGVDSTSVVFQRNKFQYRSDRILFDASDGFLRKQIKIWNLVYFALGNFDIIHYNFGRPLILRSPGEKSVRTPRKMLRRYVGLSYYSLFDFADTALFKRAGKGIVSTYQGSDARQADYCLENYEITFVREMGADYSTSESDAWKRRNIAKFNRYADRIYALSPGLIDVLPGAKYLPTSPVDMRRQEPVYPEPRAQPLLLHAPSNRRIKGTTHLLEALERLRNEGVPLDFELVENLPHSEAQIRYRRADLVVDNLLGGWYGGFAIEAMALGKPVIAYLRGSDLHVVPPEMRKELPVIDANPETIYDVLKEWLTVRRHELPERGRAARAYVERWHDARTIAKRLVGDYEAILREREANAFSQR